MLVGKSNSVNKKLVKEISEILPISFVDSNLYLEHSREIRNPRVVIINLMDVGEYEGVLYSQIKTSYPNVKILAMHCFQAESMIQQVLDRGYDGYLSIFDFSEEFSVLMEQLEITV